MFRNQDITNIKTSLDELASQSENIKLNLYEPTLSELNKIYQDIYNYAKKNKLIIYGGWAQNTLISKKEPKDAFYHETSLADIEFYSYDPIGVGMDLSNMLYKKGYKYVQLQQGVHDETYKLFVNFHNFCDISYMPKYIYDNLPTMEIDGFKLTHPHFMTVDAFRVYSDPMFSFWRLEKTFSRFSTLLKHYPLYDEKKVKQIKSIGLDDNIFKTLRKEFLHDKKLIVIHHYAYNYLMKKTSTNLLIDVPYLSVISVDYSKDVKEIYKKLNKLYPNKITTKEYYPFFQFLGRKTEFYFEGKKIFVVYSHNDRCTVYQATYSENKKTLFGTFALIRLMLLAEYFNQLIHKNKNDSFVFMTLLQNLIYGRLDYLDEKDITVMEKSPFQEFTFECLGESVDPIRQSRLNIMEKIEKKLPAVFRYDPDRNKSDKKPNYNFANTSGNPIMNEKDLTIN